MGHADSKRERMLRMEQLLLQQPMTPTELSRELKCDRSTIHDYLREMESAYYPLQTDNKGKWWLDSRHYISNVHLRREEALTIYLALRRFIRQTSYTPKFFKRAIEVITPALGHTELIESIIQSSEHLETQRSIIGKTEIWLTLIQGWLEKTTVQITYQKPRTNSQVIHDFDPYLFEPAVLSQGIYVIGWSHSRQSLRTFKIERIIKASLTLSKFERPSEITPERLLQHAWGIWYGNDLYKVELIFAPAVAPRVQETIWHPSQHTQLLENGYLYWSVEIAGLKELVPWIRGWGHEVEVISPPQLRKEISDSLKAAAALYQD